MLSPISNNKVSFIYYHFSILFFIFLFKMNKLAIVLLVLMVTSVLSERMWLSPKKGWYNFCHLAYNLCYFQRPSPPSRVLFNSYSYGWTYLWWDVVVSMMKLRVFDVLLQTVSVMTNSLYKFLEIVVWNSQARVIFYLWSCKYH